MEFVREFLVVYLLKNVTGKNVEYHKAICYIRNTCPGKDIFLSLGVKKLMVVCLTGLTFEKSVRHWSPHHAIDLTYQVNAFRLSLQRCDKNTNTHIFKTIGM